MEGTGLYQERGHVSSHMSTLTKRWLPGKPVWTSVLKAIYEISTRSHAID